MKYATLCFGFRTIVLGVALGAAGALAGCGERPTAPAADPHAGHATATPTGAAPAAGAGAADAAAARAKALEDHALLHAKGYVCPMHPQVTSDEPGECPICGMDLVPAAELEMDAPAAEAGAPPAGATTSAAAVAAPAAAQGATVRVTEGIRQALGVRTAAVEAGTLSGRVEAVARVEFDQRQAREVRVRAMGFVERLHVRAAGERVRAGQPLFSVHAPMLATARGDLERARRLGDAELLRAAEARLRALGAGGGESGRVTYRAPVDGVVAELNVLEGGQVGPEMMAAKILPTGRVWVIAAVPEALSGGVAVGTPVELRFPALPGETLTATVAEVLPELDPMTRTLQARLQLPNELGRLRPGMLGTAALVDEGAGVVVHVPLDAVIRSGRGDRVVVALGDGRYATRRVVAGREAGDRMEIRDGLVAGETVVVSGQFLIDSESTLRGSLDHQVGPAGGGANGAAGAAATPADPHAGHGGARP